MRGQLIVENGRRERIRLLVEPWGDEYELAPDERRTVKMKGPEPPEIEITVDDHGLVIYGWTGSVLDGDLRATHVLASSPATDLKRSLDEIVRRLRARLAYRRPGGGPLVQPVPRMPTEVSGITNPSEYAAELRRLLVIEVQESDLGLWSVIASARYVTGQRDVQGLVLEVLRELLTEGSAVAGSFDGPTFIRWSESPDDAIVRIRREWDAFGGEPGLGDIVWIRSPDPRA